MLTYHVLHAALHKYGSCYYNYYYSFNALMELVGQELHLTCKTLCFSLQQYF